MSLFRFLGALRSPFYDSNRAEREIRCVSQTARPEKLLRRRLDQRGMAEKKTLDNEVFSGLRLDVARDYLCGLGFVFVYMLLKWRVFHENFDLQSWAFFEDSHDDLRVVAVLDGIMLSRSTVNLEP